MIYCIEHSWHNTEAEPFCLYCFDKQVEEHMRTIKHYPSMSVFMKDWNSEEDKIWDNI